MTNFKNLKIWQRSFELSLRIYEISKSFPKEEKYCLTSQLRRSVISIPANISEGSAKTSRKDFIRFFEIALGSLCEVETYVELSVFLGYISTDLYRDIGNLVTELKKMLSAYISKTKASANL